MNHEIIELFSLLSSIIGLATGFIIVLFFPPIFNFIIIPRIEKKLGKKLQYRLQGYRFIPSNRYFLPAGDISLYIVIKYLMLKIAKNPNFKFKKIYANLALETAEYPITMASHFEIVMSFIVIIDALLCIASAIAFWILNMLGA
jgi:hypothetical protein